MDEKTLKSLLLGKAEKYTEEIFGLNDFMAENPETGSEEYNSSAAIVKVLRNHGVDTEYPFAGFETAFI